PPRVARVTPGIRIDVSPTVLPDGGSARLKIDAIFGLTSSEVGNRTAHTAKADITRQVPPDVIKAHRVTTDTAVSVFDLFDISSFSISTSFPQSPFSIPVLGRLPLLGPAFQVPRPPRRVLHESVVLVNNVILPRSPHLAAA